MKSYEEASLTKPRIEVASVKKYDTASRRTETLQNFVDCIGARALAAWIVTAASVDRAVAHARVGLGLFLVSTCVYHRGGS
eukprot:COSAG02_NODE_2688_length_8234_cov_45.754230_5_plen_81_part_00